jgi:hypothetical protein
MKLFERLATQPKLFPSWQFLRMVLFCWKDSDKSIWGWSEDTYSSSMNLKIKIVKIDIHRQRVFKLIIFWDSVSDLGDIMRVSMLIKSVIECAD